MIGPNFARLSSTEQLRLRRLKASEAAVKIAMKIIGGENGEAMIGNKTLSQAQAEALLKDRFTALENTMLDKLAEIGVVSVED